MLMKPSRDWSGDWVWPVPTSPTLGPVVISQEWRRPSHLGVDLMYRDTWGSWQAPEGTKVVAARAGKVWSVGQTARGWNVVLDHGPSPWATFYQHLSKVTVAKGDVVTAGQELGLMGADPTDAQHLRHLHFATWWKGWGDAASVDPAAAMGSWRRVAS